MHLKLIHALNKFLTKKLLSIRSFLELLILKTLFSACIIKTTALVAKSYRRNFFFHNSI